MAEEFRVGPGHVLTAAALTDPVEGWTDLGNTRGEVAVQLEEGHLAFGRVDQSGRSPRADGVSFIGHRVVLRFPMLDHQLEKLQTITPNAVLNEAGELQALGLGLKAGASVTPRSWSLVPLVDYTPGSAWWDSADTIWIPEGVLHVLGEWRGELPEGEDVLGSTAYEVEIIGVDGGSSLPAPFRSGGVGPILVAGIGVLGIDLLWETDPDGADTLDAATQALIGGALTVSRNSTATYLDPTDDTWKSAAVNTLRIEAEGALVEPQRTNKAQNTYLHAGAITGWAKGGDAAATLTAVTDAVELAAAGLDVLCSDDYVVKLDNSAGVAEAWAENAGTAGNTNPHVASAFVRGGTGSVRIGAVEAIAFVASAAYSRRIGNVTPGAADALRIYADAGEIVYFVLAQLEEGTVETNPIPNNTAGSVTREADQWTDAYTTVVDETHGIALQVDFTPRYGEGAAVDSYVVTVGSAADPRLALRHATGGAWRLTLDDGATEDDQALDGEAFPADAESEATIGYDPGLAGKYFAFDADTNVTPAAPATAALSGTWGGSVIQLGGSGSVTLNGHIRRIVACRGLPASSLADVPARLRALTRSS